MDEPTQVELEKYKAEWLANIERDKAINQLNLEMLKSVITAGQGAINVSFLLNEASAVALLASISHLAQINPAKVPTFGACLVPFCLGVFSITFTSGSTYVSQWFYDHRTPKKEKWGQGFNILSVISGLASYICFLRGLYLTYQFFLRYA